MGIVSGEEIVFPREDVIHAGPACLCEQRGSDSAARGHAPEMKRFLNVLGVAIPCAEPGGLMRGIAQHPAHLLGVQACSATGRGGRAEERRNAVGAPMTFCLEPLTAQGHCEAGTDVVPERHGAQKVCSADAKPLTRSQSSRNDGAAWMRL